MKISKGLLGEDVSVEDAKRILQHLRISNSKFFSKLSTEITHCIFNLKLKRHVEAFLYFYRAVEKLAVAFPILYVSGQQDFYKSHHLLKSLVQKQGDGELAFLNRFCAMIAESSGYLKEYKVRFTFPTKDLGEYSAILNEIKAVVSEEISAEMTEEEGYFEIPYRLSSSLIIDCRNRLFHNSNSGQRNFDISRIGGASDLCEGLVIAGLQWLSLTYLEIVQDRAARV